MATAAIDLTASEARRRYLATVVADGGHVRASTALLLLDTVAAVGFAGGVAGAIAAIASGRGDLLGWALLATLSGALRGLFAMLAGRSGAAGARTAKMRLRRRIVAAVLHRPFGGARTTGELVNAAVDEVEAIDGHVSRFLPARQAAAVAPLLVLGATAIASPVSAGILAATLFPFIVALALAGGAAADESHRQFSALARLSGLLGDRVRALPVILAFGAQARETERIGQAAEQVASRTLRVLRVAFLSTGALEFFAALSVALVAVYCGFNLLGLLPFPVPEKLTLPEAFFVLALAPEFYAPMRRLAAAYHDRQAAETAAERLTEVEAEYRTSLPLPVDLTGPPALFFDHVTIRYPGEERDAVAGLSFAVRAGETVALTGPSGSGKSSLLHLLLGLAPLASGQVRIDGEALPPGGSIAEHVAWASQSTLIVPGTIAANIALARQGATQHEVAAVAHVAGLNAMLANRPEGLDTLLDERGSGLSGGERSRIGLARALLKPAPLLLLDEPAAHLDSAAAAELIAVIRKACVGRTTLIATHSGPLAEVADRIVALDKPA